MLFTSITSVYAVLTIESNSVSYDNTTSGLSSTNVKGAIDELYNYCSYPMKLNFDYTGEDQSFIVPVSGTYKVELWGASSENAIEVAGDGIDEEKNAKGGKGGYTSGKIQLTKGKIVYVYVGGEGKRVVQEIKLIQGGYNGGGNGNLNRTTCYNQYASGGGATDIRIFSSAPSSEEILWNSVVGLNSRIMVASGGGGLVHSHCPDQLTVKSGGDGGGLEGYTGNGNSWIASYGSPTGGSQTAGGKGSLYWYSADMSSTTYVGSFGVGAIGSESYSGGGSGYYGGASGNWKLGGGGSSYISGHTGCVAIKEGSTTDPREVKISGCETGTTNNDCSIHYSNMVFTETVMIDGKGCKWTNELTTDCAGQPQPDGTTTTGHSGNGYARITLLSIEED